MELPIHVWSDVACPWCWVGKRHLEAALEKFDHSDAVTLHWHAFELDPKAPEQLPPDPPYVDRLAKKYRTDRSGAQEMIDRMTATAAKSGLTMNFDVIRPGNTFAAHRLIHLAGLHDQQTAMKERLFKAYLEEGAPIGDRATLEALAKELGLPEDEVRDALDSDELGEQIRGDEAAAAELGITGVPFFIVGGRLAFSGAQPADVMLEVLQQAWDEIAAEQKTPQYAEGAACGPDGC